jgi:hypothetical protein
MNPQQNESDAPKQTYQYARISTPDCSAANQSQGTDEQARPTYMEHLVLTIHAAIREEDRAIARSRRQSRRKKTADLPVQ